MVERTKMDFYDDIDFGDLDFQSKRDRKSIPYLPDLHLRTAIRRSERALFCELIGLVKEYGTKEINAPPHILQSMDIFLSETEKNFPSTTSPQIYLGQYSEVLYGQIFSQDLIPILEKDLNFSHQDWEKNRALTSRIALPSQEVATGGLLENPDPSEIEVRVHNFEPSKPYHEYTAMKLFWERIRNQIAQAKKTNSKLAVSGVTHNKLPFIVTNTFYFLYTNTVWFVLDYEQIQMICDTLNSRALVIRAADFYHHLGVTYQPPSALAGEIFNWGDQVLTNTGNDGYNIIKSYEPLITALLLLTFETHPKCHEYYNSLMRSAEKDGSAWYLQRLVDIIQKYELDPNQMFELSGYFRMFGHPTVDEIEGVQKQRDLVREKLEVDQECVKEAAGGLIRLIVTEYISKNGRWPKCYISPDARVSSTFSDIVQYKSSIIDDRLRSISLFDWAELVFEQNSPLNDIVDPTELVSDKSCSLPRSKYHLSYNSSITRDLGLKQEPHTRRLLTELLRDENFDPVSIRETIQSRKIPKGWLIVGLCSKERELKVTGRLFTVLNAEVRYGFGVSQKNIADSIMPYVSGQTMTLNDAQLVNKMYKQTTQSRKNTECRVVISIDFEKFNQRWRRESIHRVTTLCDQWFGTNNFFSFVHDFFDNAFFYLCSSYEPPENLRKEWLKKDERTFLSLHPEYKDNRCKDGSSLAHLESKTTWEGQAGAGEGLWQKGWTIAIIGALHAVEYKTGIHSSIMGQGDNQVIVVSWEIPFPDLDQETYIRDHGNLFQEVIDRYLTELTRIVNGMGMKVKLEETWVSTKFLSYGKEAWFNGVYMTSVMKRVGRTFQEVNDIHPTFANRLGSVFSTGYSCATKDYNQIIPYLLAIMEAASMLRTETVNSPINGSRIKSVLSRANITVTEDIILCALLLPKEFGGFPCIPFTEFLFRGHPDPVTSGLYWLKICAKYLPEVKKILTWISSRDGINETVKDTDIERLIQDPVCLNFRSFGQYSSEVARQLEGNLRTHVKNRQLRILFSRDTTNYRTKMIKYLDSIHPCFPRILNEVLRISPLGAQQAFLAQFRDIKTLKNLMGVQDGSILVDLIRDGDIKNVVGVLSLVKKILSNESKIIRDFPHSYREKVKEDWECTTMLADRLREASWGRPVMGSTTPYPQEQFKAHKTTTYPSCPTTAKEHILAILIPSDSKHSISGTKYPYNHQLSRGHMPAYTGSITSEKRTTGLISFQKSENGARATQRALHLKNWVFHSEGTVKHLLEDIVESRCDIPVDTLESLIGEHYGGSMTHRFRCVMLKHTQAPNMRPNISTHVQLSSDRMGIYSRGFDNYTMLFQSIYLTIYANLANLEILSEDLKTSAQIAYHYHVNCLGCCQLVEDIPLYTDLPKPRMPDFKKCPLVYTKCDEVVQKSSWVFDKRLTLKRPSPIPSENLPYSIHACAFIVLGMNEQANALTLVGDSRQPDKIRYDHTISIGVIIRLGIENVIKTVSELWCLCYYEDLVHMTKGTSLNIESVLGYMLNRSTTGLWDSLKPLILIPEIADRLVKMTNLKPNNVKAFFSGEGLDSYLSLLSKRYIQDWITSGYKPPVVLTPAKNMPIMRLVRIWSVATVLNRLHADPIRMKKVLLKLGPLLRSCWKDGTFDSNYWHISWASFAKAEFEVSSSDKSIWPPLSEVSAETWLKPINMPVQCDPSRIDPIVSLQLWKSYMMCVLSQKAVFSIELEHMNNETLREQSIERTLKNLQTSIMEEFSMSVNQLKSREDHQYRLVGVHSTAPLKYIEIFARAGVINVEESMHIAEGAGGVANLAHRLNNSSMVYYNSLMDVKESISHRFGVFVPPSLLDVNSKFKLIGPQKCVETGGDITSPEVLEYYCNLMKSSNNIDLLTCDAETSGQFSVDIAINITMSVARLSSHMMPGRKVIYKTFCHSKTLLALQCQILSGTLRDLTIMVPCFSSHESYEVFIVGSVRQDPWFCSGRIRTNDNLVESLNILTELEDRYQPDHPFQRRYPLLVESSLALCKYIGLECNKPHAMSALTGGFLDDQTYPSNNSRLKIYKTQEEIKSGMVLKLKALTEKKSGHRMVAERDLLYKEAKLKLEFQVITEYHLNLQLMNYLLSHKTLSDIQWSQNYSIYQDGILLFSIELNRTAWWARYAKHWQKLIGHVSRDTTFQPLPLLPGRCTNVVTFVYWVRYQVKSTTGFNYLTYIGNCSLLYNSPLHTYPLALGDWRPGPAHRPFRPRPAAGRSGGVIP